MSGFETGGVRRGPVVAVVALWQDAGERLSTLSSCRSQGPPEICCAGSQPGLGAAWSGHKFAMLASPIRSPLDASPESWAVPRPWSLPLRTSQESALLFPFDPSVQSVTVLWSLYAVLLLLRPPSADGVGNPALSIVTSACLSQMGLGRAMHPDIAGGGSPLRAVESQAFERYQTRATAPCPFPRIQWMAT